MTAPAASRLAGGGAWSLDESLRIGETSDAFRERGGATGYEHGVTDEGDPWTVFHEARNGMPVAHVARDGCTYVLIWRDRPPMRASDLSRLARAIRGS